MMIGGGVFMYNQKKDLNIDKKLDNTLTPKNNIDEYKDIIYRFMKSFDVKPLDTQSKSEKILKNEDIVGVWQKSSVMAAGWNGRYQFFVSGKYNHRPSQMVCNSSDRGNSGYWKINNDNNVELNIIQKISVDEKQIIPDEFGGCGTPDIIDKVSLDKVVIVDTCTGTKSNPLSLKCIALDGVEYYRFSKDPKDNMNPELEDELVFLSSGF